MNKRLVLALISLLFVSTTLAAPVPPATNKDGSIVSGKLTADFVPPPLGASLPFPTNLLLLGTTDLTLNPPVDDPDDFSDPAVVLSAMDGFSTIEKWSTTITGFPNPVDPSSVVPGQSVRFFEVSLTPGTAFVTGIVAELIPGVDYFAAMANSTVLIIVPLKPLKELTNYMAVLTNDINDTVGNDASADTFYGIAKSTTPWADENGNSTYPLIPDSLAPTAELLRQIVNSQEIAASSAGIPREDIILSWVAATQSTTAVLKNLRSIARPAPTEVVPTGMNTTIMGGLGNADIYMGVITLPYYGGVPSAGNPIAPLTDFWQAAPGAYVPPFDSFGLDPTSTHVTYANPFPVKTSDQTVPLLITTPNAQSGQVKPAAGWPVVIYGHGLGWNRAQVLLVADAIANAGYAAIAIDSGLHGITPQDTPLEALYIENTPWADVANERTFDVDYVNNVTGAAEPDGIVDASGTHFFNFRSFLTFRDNMRQAEADLSVLAVTLPMIDIDGDGLPDLDASTVSFAGMAVGAIVGTPFTAFEPMITNSFLSVGMGGIARGLEASEFFGPGIKAALAGMDIFPGTSLYESFFTILQTALDSADPINWAAEAARLKNVLFHEVIGDQFVPNGSPTAPLSGTEPLMAAMGLTSYSDTLANPAGIDGAGRFLSPAVHTSLYDPTASPAATVEMQKQMASFLLSKGTVVFVENASTMQDVPQPEPDAETDEGADQ